MADFLLEPSPDLLYHGAGRYREKTFIDMALPESLVFTPVIFEKPSLACSEHGKCAVAAREDIETFHSWHGLANRACAPPFEDAQSSTRVSPFQVSLCQVLPKESGGGAHQNIQFCVRVSPFGINLI